MSEDNERELSREELKAQLEAEFQAEQETSQKSVAEPEDNNEQGEAELQTDDETDVPSPETEDAEPDMPNHESNDHLPIKSTWQVILYSLFYFAFGTFLTVVSLNLIFSQKETGEAINLFGWVFIIFFLIGGLASLYSTYDEIRHLKNARLLDNEGVSFQATILDNWVDHYQDGGFLGRKKVHHLLYFYNDEKNYAKHSVNQSMSKTLHTGSSITVEYLQENPEVFRIK
ncbi:MAG: DUF3592 domain-containing protein [Anaerolineaceae bacterium]|nr:DUF3592 domain-containing protein [Anaerolineaceae bacterium]